MKQARATKREVPSVKRLRRRLLRVSIRLDRKAQSSVLAESVGGSIIISLFAKAIKAFRAIDLLKEKGFIEEAWELCRSLLETTVNVLYFLQNDPAMMARRFVDAQRLDVMKRVREANFYHGTPLATHFDRQAMEKEYAECCSNYTPDEIKAMKRNGFTGLSFEQRGQQVGLGHMYEYYRVASRNLHTFDPADAPGFLRMMSGGASLRRQLLRHRLFELDVTRIELLGRLCSKMHDLIGSSEAPELTSIITELREILGVHEPAKKEVP